MSVTQCNTTHQHTTYFVHLADCSGLEGSEDLDVGVVDKTAAGWLTAVAVAAVELQAAVVFESVAVAAVSWPPAAAAGSQQ